MALVEVAGSHDECLLTQMHALKSRGCNVMLVSTQEIRERNPEFEAYIDDYYIVSLKGPKFRRYSEMRRVLKYMEKAGVTRAVLNTAQGDLIRNLSLVALFSGIEFTGIIHTTRKFRGSFTQRVISRKVKKYLLLSEFLLSTVEPPKGIILDYFYPIRFTMQDAPKIEHAGMNVVIIGGVENRRKDLTGFCEMLDGIPENVHFTFLGRSNPKSQELITFIERLEAIGMRNRVTLFNSFIDQVKFTEELRKADAILPLVHPETPSADQYFKNQIAGAMSVSFGFKIPMLIHTAYKHIEEMQPASFYYSQDNFSAALTKVVDESSIKKKEMEAKYVLEEQEQRYLSFVFQ